jgi:hypothetical protein
LLISIAGLKFSLTDGDTATWEEYTLDNYSIAAGTRFIAVGIHSEREFTSYADQEFKPTLLRNQARSQNLVSVWPRWALHGGGTKLHRSANWRDPRLTNQI